MPLDEEEGITPCLANVIYPARISISRKVESVSLARNIIGRPLTTKDRDSQFDHQSIEPSCIYTHIQQNQEKSEQTRQHH